MSSTEVTEEGRCAECGAARVEGMTCWEQLGAVLAWEWQDAALAAEHFLTVASYNIQHPAQFMDDALEGLRAALIAQLDEGTSTKEIRRRLAGVYEGKRRVLRPAEEQRPVRRRWGVTVDEVYAPGPERAAERVRAWAAAIRREM